MQLIKPIAFANKVLQPRMSTGMRTSIVLTLCVLLTACSDAPTIVYEPNNNESKLFSVAGPHWQDLDSELRAEFEAAHKEAVLSSRDRGVYHQYLPLAGPVALLDYLEQEYPACHGQAHALGKEIFSQSQDMMLALQICGTRCTGACMHGVVGEALGGLHGDITLEMQEFCSSDAMATHKRGNCAHAIGHALLLNSRDLGYALESCQGFEQHAMGYYCATGVYMQYRDWLHAGEIPDERPTSLYPCDAQALYPAACYRYMMSFIQIEFEGRTDLITNACLELSDYQRWGCFHGLGMQAGPMVMDWMEHDKTILRDLCKHGTLIDQTMCIEGVIEKMADFDEGAAHTACDELNGEIATVCHLAAREKMYRLDKPSLKYYVARPEALDEQ